MKVSLDSLQGAWVPQFTRTEGRNQGELLSAAQAIWVEISAEASADQWLDSQTK